MEVIPDYIKKLEDAQKQSNRAGNPITDPTPLLLVDNTMFRTDCLPRANEKWEDLDSADSNCTKWKTIYRKSDMAEKLKKTAQGRQD